MTKLNLSKFFRGIKPFLFRTKNRYAYLKSLEQAYLEKSEELSQLKRRLHRA